MYMAAVYAVLYPDNAYVNIGDMDPSKRILYRVVWSIKEQHLYDSYHSSEAKHTCEFFQIQWLERVKSDMKRRLWIYIKIISHLKIVRMMNGLVKEQLSF